MFQSESENLSARIVTGDETWVNHMKHETKQQSKVWKRADESAPKKTKMELLVGKVMATVF